MMTENRVVDLKNVVSSGELFYPPDDRERIEAYIPTPYHSNHAANLAELDNGDLLCVWFAGSAEGVSDIKIVMARLNLNETKWSAPVQLSHDYARSEQNPFLFPAPDGKLWLCYTAQATRGASREEWRRMVEREEAKGTFAMQETSVIRRRLSEDNGHTWGAVTTLFGKSGSFCRSPVVVLSNGDWLFPMYYSLQDGETAHGSDHSVVQISSDQGGTWAEYPIPQSRGRVHASVVEVEDGQLVAFFRSRAADRIYMSHSEDYGRTWTRPRRTALPNNNASIQAVKLASGNIAIVFNNMSANEDATLTVWPPERYPITVGISEDRGETWPYMRHVDPGDNFCGEKNKHLNRRYAYPSIMQSRDGRIHIAYSYAGRQCIKYVCVAENWITGQGNV